MIKVFDHIMEFVKTKLSDRGLIIGLLRQCEVRYVAKCRYIFH